MTKAVIEVMVEERNRISDGEPNPFRGHNREILWAHLESGFSGFLIRRDAIKFKVNTDMLFARIALFKDQLLIGKFVGPKPNPKS